MTEPRDAWREVAGKAEALGLKLKLHLEQERHPDAETSTEDAKAVIDDLGRKLQEAFDSIGNAAKDPAVHEDVKDMGRLVVDAISSTFAAVGAEVQHRSAEHGATATDDADTDDAAAGDESEGGDS